VRRRPALATVRPAPLVDDAGEPEDEDVPLLELVPAERVPEAEPVEAGAAPSPPVPAAVFVAPLAPDVEAALDVLALALARNWSYVLLAVGLMAKTMPAAQWLSGLV